MVDLNNPSAVRRLVKKLWCHGQAIAPLQGAAYGWFAAVATEKEVTMTERVLLVASACVLPVWGYVSWKQMKKSSPRSTQIILSLGTMMQLLHITIVFLASTKLTVSANLLIFIFTLLHLVETTAYLLAVFYFRASLQQDHTAEQDQVGLLG